MQPRRRPQSHGGKPVERMEMHDNRPCAARLLKFLSENAVQLQERC